MNDARDKLKAIYQDLRNQRLLPVAAVLIIAIIAVPMALGSGGADVAPKTELAVGIEPLAETQPVVVAATPELRNFHKRLNEFAKKNPFHQPEPLPVPKTGSSDGSAASTASGSTATASGSTADAAATTAAATSTGTSATVPTTPTDTGTTPTDATTTGTSTTGTSTTDTTGSGSTGTTDTTSSGAQVLTYEADVLVGAAGAEKEVGGVKSLDLLPDKTHPVLQYVTTDVGGTRASFIVSNAVTGADGDGRCAPSRFDCQFLQLEVGQAERFEYGTTPRTYRIKLLGLTQHLDPVDVAGSAAGNVSGRIGFSAGLPSADISFTPAG